MSEIYIITKLAKIIIIKNMGTLWSEIQESGYTRICWRIIYISANMVCVNILPTVWSDLWSEKKFPISEAIHFPECLMIYTFGNILSLITF